MSNAAKGVKKQPFSEEHKKKIATARSLKAKSVVGIRIEDNSSIFMLNVKKQAIIFGLQSRRIYESLSGKRANYAGYVWHYAETL